MLALKILLLLTAANGAPILLCKWLDERWRFAVDGGLLFLDGRPLLGPSKTWRGIASALSATALAGWAFGLGWWTGLAVGALAMLGDLFSSFLKRRLGIPISGMALGLDQLPESMFPLLWLRTEWNLSLAYVLWLAAAFLALELAISQVLYRLRIRRQPY